VFFNYKIKKIDLPLSTYVDNGHFKIYLNDTGLLCSMLGTKTPIHFINDLLGENKGGIFENAICTIIAKNNYQSYYYKPYENSSEDVEFVLESSTNIKLLEVKAANSKAKTLQNSMNNKTYNIKLINGNIGFNDKVLSIP
jgi:predicted AAA+ superfamily ATPase